MMIGGEDIIIEDAGGPAALDLCVRLISRRWPGSVIEDGTGEIVVAENEQPQGKLREVFIYEDEKTAEIWEEEGAIPSVSNRMIHLLHKRDELTIVVGDSEAGDIPEILRELREAIGRNRLVLGTTVPEAA